MAQRKLPQAAKMAGGHYRPSRDSYETTDPLKGSGFPEAPAWISAPARFIWSEVNSMISGLGLITDADSHTLARYCELESQFRENPIDFPVGRLSSLRMLANDLYLSPEARAKIGASLQVEQANEFDSL